MLKQLKHQLIFAFFPVQKEAILLKDKLPYTLKPHKSNSSNRGHCSPAPQGTLPHMTTKLKSDNKHNQITNTAFNSLQATIRFFRALGISLLLWQQTESNPHTFLRPILSLIHKAPASSKYGTF